MTWTAMGTPYANGDVIDEGDLEAIRGNLNHLKAGDVTGQVIAYAGTSTPTDWLLCDGSAVSRTTYADLFAVIGTTYGSGDGSTTFNVPDLRGRVVAGQDDMGGTSANRLTGASGSLDGDVMGATGGAETGDFTHNHIVGAAISTTAIVAGGGVVSTGNYTGASSGGSTPLGNKSVVQPTLILNYLIRC